MNVLNFVIVGHVDHGKSTLIGRLLYDTDSLAPDKIEEIKKASTGQGKRTEFAYLLDHLEEERKQGITIDTTQVFFKSPKRRYVIIDAPGHVEFVKNMITGASQAEAAVLIVDVKEGVQEQTRRHSYMLSLLGLNQVVVVLNKMDLVDFSEQRFNTVKAEAQKWLKSINIEAMYYIPISAIEGDNVAAKSKNMGWYTGPTFLDSLDTMKNKQPPENKPLLFPIQDVYKIDNGQKIHVERGIIEKMRIQITAKECKGDVDDRGLIRTAFGVGQAKVNAVKPDTTRQKKKSEQDEFFTGAFRHHFIIMIIFRRKA